MLFTAAAEGSGGNALNLCAASSKPSIMTTVSAVIHFIPVKVIYGFYSLLSQKNGFTSLN